MNRMFRMAPGPGFTLVELLAVLAVLSIVLLLAAPPMQRLVQGSQLRSEASRLRLALNLARTEAVSRNAPVSLCPGHLTDDGLAVCGGSFDAGWLVFSDPDRDGDAAPGRDVPIRAFGPVATGFRITDRGGAAAVTSPLTYWQDGATRRNVTLMVCPPTGSTLGSLSVVVNRVGRPRLARDFGECRGGEG